MIFQLCEMGNRQSTKVRQLSKESLKESLKESIKILNAQFLVQNNISNTKIILPIFDALISNLDSNSEQVLLILIMFQIETIFNANEYSRLHSRLIVFFLKNRSFISRNLKNRETIKKNFDRLNNDLDNILTNLYINLKWLDDTIKKNEQNSLGITDDIIKYASDLFKSLDLVFPQLKENIDS